MSVADNLARIRESIGTAPVKLIAVTKSVGPAEIAEALACGVTEFGENRVVDALEKQDAIRETIPETINWHLIGHLQTNKVKKVVGRFALIHSVDSLRLAIEISHAAQRLSIVQPILLQVKILPDPNKAGFNPAELKLQLPEIMSLPGVKVDGLMTIAPLSEDSSVWTESFEGLRALREEIETLFGVRLNELSMGMSADWQQAVKCGATMVRLGRAIFGN